MKASQVVIVALALTLAACAKKVNVEPGAAPTPYNAPDITGTWKTGCAQGNGGAYEIRSFIIEGAALKNTTDIFFDSACAQNGGTYTSLEGTYTATGENASLAGALNIEVKFTDMNGNAKTGYTVVLVEESSLYLGSYLGLNPESRPSEVDRAFAYKKVATP